MTRIIGSTIPPVCLRSHDLPPMSRFCTPVSLGQIVSISVFLFFSLMLLVPSGYSYGAALLLLTSLAFIVYGAISRYAPRLGSADKWVIAALVGVFAVSLLMLLVHGNRPKFLDQSLRCLLAVPILVLLIKVPPRLCLMWAGMIVGALGAAVIAVWQVHFLGIERATGFVTSAIPFGGLALAMGIFCIPGLFWARTQGRRCLYWRIALLLGVAAGAYASLASGSRGGWLALLPVGLLLCCAYLNKYNIKRAFVLMFVCVAGLTALFVMPDSMVKARYDQAVQEVNSYLEDHHVATSVGARLEVWRAAGILIQERPLLGWKVSDYHLAMEQLVADKQVDPYVLELSNTHNNFLQTWLTEGLLGLIALLALFMVPFWLFCQRLRSSDVIVKVMAVSGACLLASFFSFGMTQVILGRNNGIMFFAISLAIFWGCMRHREHQLRLPHGGP